MVSLIKFTVHTKKEERKTFYLEERKIPITKMIEETETATEIERKQMMVERGVYLYNNPARSSQSNKTNQSSIERKFKRMNRL